MELLFPPKPIGGGGGGGNGNGGGGAGGAGSGAKGNAKSKKRLSSQGGRVRSEWKRYNLTKLPDHLTHLER